MLVDKIVRVTHNPFQQKGSCSMAHSDWRAVVAEARRALVRAPVSDWRAAVADFRRARRQALAREDAPRGLCGRWRRLFGLAARRGWWRRLFGLAPAPLLP
jgi:hypothetical protein